ncbi:MAG TPA: flavin reductase family protein [Phycisphaerae bacterium]|nr:flavin reductase family protein [Phycisphaerae bacterium]HPS53266.1 flavin reductase family protein [Phycisphaerae bacterium]
MKEFPLAKVFHLLEPGPTVLVTTASKESGSNIMTMSWHMMMEFQPPLIACVVSPCNYSYAALLSTKQCVIAIPTVELAATVVGIGNCDAPDVNKFEKFSLTPLPAKKVKAPLIAECIANIECKVTDTRMANKYAMFILTAVQAWFDPKHKEHRMIHHNGDGTFEVDDKKTLNLRRKMTKWKDIS